jgi:hypothetical protein
MERNLIQQSLVGVLVFIAVGTAIGLVTPAPQANHSTESRISFSLLHLSRGWDSVAKAV